MEICTPFKLRETANTLYEKTAKHAPIYDYHCHLSPQEIAANAPFCNIAGMLLGEDHYKWRAMRYMGVAEELITGNGTAKKKFKAWAKTCSQLAGSPLYYWSHLEMKMFFDVNEQLCEDNADRIYVRCNQIIADRALSPQKIIESMNVHLICTTDDPCDTLEYHKQLSGQKLTFRVLPTFRPDKALTPADSGFKSYISRLSSVSGQEIHSLKDLLTALETRLDYFCQSGCRLSDHSVESMLWEPLTETDVELIFGDAMNGKHISREQNDSFCFYLLTRLAAMYAARDVAMQLHIGALRNSNTVQLEKLGRDTGYDIVNDFNIADSLTCFLDTAQKSGGLPRTILYTTNPKNYSFLASICPCFTSRGVSGKVQLGAAWWHCDTKKGILEQIQHAADYGLLSNSWGMLTDSRSFLSYARHHYFRMILCDYLGGLFDNGEYFGTMESLVSLTESISYKNIKNFMA